MLILPHLASIPASCSCFISLLLFLSMSWCQVGTTAEHCGGVRHGALDEAANDALQRNSSIPAPVMDGSAGENPTKVLKFSHESAVSSEKVNFYQVVQQDICFLPQWLLDRTTWYWTGGLKTKSLLNWSKFWLQFFSLLSRNYLCVVIIFRSVCARQGNAGRMWKGHPFTCQRIFTKCPLCTRCPAVFSHHYLYVGHRELQLNLCVLPWVMRTVSH